MPNVLFLPRRVLVAAAIGVLASAGALASCSSSNHSGSTTVPSASGTIGRNGGTVATSDGAVTLSIPSGALNADTAITITPIAAPRAGTVGQVYEIGPTGTQFATPITLAFAYTDAELGGAPAASAAIATLVGDEWQPIGAGGVDTSARILRGTTTHLSPYGVVLAGVGDSGAGDVDAGTSDVDAGTSDVDAGDANSDAGDGATACTMCNGACVDLQTDNANCGACASACSAAPGSAAECNSGRCVQTLVANAAAKRPDGDPNFVDLQRAGDDLVWMDNDNCILYSLPAAGGTLTKLVNSTNTDAGVRCSCTSGATTYLSATASQAYWSGGGICQIALAGGPTTLVAAGNDIFGALFGLIATPGALYFADNKNGIAALDGTSTTPRVIAPLDPNGSFSALALDGTTLGYVATGHMNSLPFTQAYSVAASGGTPTSSGSVTLPSDVGRTGVRAGGALYVIIGTFGFPYGIAKFSDGAATPSAFYTAPADSFISGIAASATTLYFGETNRDALTVAIKSAPLSGNGSAEVYWAGPHTSDVSTVNSIAIDDTSLYWTTFETRLLSRVLSAPL